MAIQRSDYEEDSDGKGALCRNLRHRTNRAGHGSSGNLLRNEGTTWREDDGVKEVMLQSYSQFCRKGNLAPGYQDHVKTREDK